MKEMFFKQSALYLTIKNYARISAFEVIDDFRSPETGESIGRHFEEAILTFWKSRHLPFRKKKGVAFFDSENPNRKKHLSVACVDSTRKKQ